MNDVLAACTVHVDVYAVWSQLTRVAPARRAGARTSTEAVAGAQGLVNRIGTYKTKYFEFTHVRVKTRRSLASSFRNRYRSRRPGAALLPRLPTRPFDYRVDKRSAPRAAAAPGPRDVLGLCRVSRRETPLCDTLHAATKTPAYVVRPSTKLYRTTHALLMLTAFSCPRLPLPSYPLSAALQR